MGVIPVIASMAPRPIFWAEPELLEGIYLILDPSEQILGFLPIVSLVMLTGT